MPPRISLFTLSTRCSIGTKSRAEIVHRNRLTLGFVALLGLTALTTNSTNGMVRRLGSKRWQRLHQAIYLIGLFVSIHYFLRFKLIKSTPTLATGLFGWLIGYRLLVANPGSELPTWILKLKVVVAALTFIAEAIAPSASSQRLPAKGAAECVLFRLRYDPAGLARARRGPHGGGARFRVRALCQAAPRRALGGRCARGLTRLRAATGQERQAHAPMM